ncbi:MAG: M15 family metallopeptidase [Acidimicrobiia bacterium]
MSLLVACSGSGSSPATSNLEPPTPSAVVTTASTTTTLSETTTTGTTGAPIATTAPPEPGTVRPDWLGTRLLELRPDGLGVPQPTPPELVNRRFPSPDLLPPPSGEAFEWTAGSVPEDVANRSSWREECPVALEGLTYLTMSFHGFDGLAHTGEMLVAAEFADGVVEAFRRLWEVRFPIEEMRVQDQEEMDAHPTGDGNVTGSFECRPAVGQSGGWSMHAYGLAVDINPFHNPYTKGEVVAPELASSYIDRTNVRPGMILEGDMSVGAFDEMGWGWGGRWTTAKDWMHFSSNGR